MPMPTKRTPAVVEEILRRLTQGETLAAICRSNEKLPVPMTWFNWCAADEDLSLAYARARDAGESVIAEQCKEIAASEPKTYATEHGLRVDPGDVAHKKLMIETNLKLLAIWNPKKYGAKVDVTTDNKPIVADTTDIAARTAALLAAARARKGNADG